MKNFTLGVLVLASFSLSSAFAGTVQIKLTKKPVITEEGIHLKTTGGDKSMYAVNASPQVQSAFRKAVKGQCLELETENGFDFSDASLIVSVKNCPAFEKVNFEQLEKWKPEVKGDEFIAGMNQVVAETSTHILVREDAGVSCAAGNHWLFTKSSKSYRQVDCGTCDDRKFKAILKADKLIFMNGNKITAQYPVY